MGYNSKDYYTKKAKDENYAARSVFKLKEMDQKYKIFKSGQNILDLGAAPGSWSQYASEKIGPKGFLLGLDLTEIKLKLNNSVFIQADILNCNILDLLQEAKNLKSGSSQSDLPRLNSVEQQSGLSTLNSVEQQSGLRTFNSVEHQSGLRTLESFEVVMSDMAPKTTGIKLTDQTRSLELCEMALSVADKHLKTNGIFICKLFHSEDFKDFQNKLKSAFKKVNVIKPKATRQISKEIFFVALSKKET